jgi:signal transduction histidine kinase
MRALAQMPALTQESARQLLQDTSFCLQSQAVLVDKIKNNLMGEGDTKRKDGVIKASRAQVNLLDWKGHLERQQVEQLTMHQADKALRNLQVLHKDTLQLTTHLLESKRIWDNDFENTASNQAVVASSMEQIRSRHATTLETMADLVLLLRGCSSNHYELIPQDVLISFLRGRLGVQVLCDHYVGWSKGKKNGGVSVDCSLEPILDESKTEALHLCDAHYERHPEILLPTDYPSLTVIRPWVHHALVEVLKNAMVASMEIMEQENLANPPPIEIELVEEGDDSVSILIHDHGQGLPPSTSDGSTTTTKHDFLFASSAEKWDRLDVQQSYATVRSPLSSLGVGLPSSQWLLQHFGGDLELRNRGGDGDDGCTAVLRLPLNDDLPEFLP